MKINKVLLLGITLVMSIKTVFAQLSYVYEFDKLNRLTRIEYSNGQVVEFTYDKVGNRLAHVVTPYTVEQTVTVPSGNPEPIEVENTQVTLDFSSGPGGEVVVQEIFAPPPMGTQSVGLASHFSRVGGAEDTLIFARRYWKLSSNMATGSFEYVLKLGYDLQDFPSDIDEEQISIFYYDSTFADYVELPTERLADVDSVQTSILLDHFGRFALGAVKLKTIEVQFTFPVPSAAWYLISLPVMPDDNRVSALFPFAVAAFGWDMATQTYKQVSNLEPERAYWLLTLDSTTVTISGIPVKSYIKIYNQQGWDMIGSVLDSSEVLDNPDNSVAAMFKWDPLSQNYVMVNPYAVEPLEGYWVLVYSVPCTVSVGISPLLMTGVGKVGPNMALEALYEKYGKVPPAPPVDALAASEVIKPPSDYALSQNYPNPFNPETVIEYQLPEAGRVSLIVYDLLGREVRTLVARELPAGYHRVVWDGRDDRGRRLESGLYFIRLQVNEFVAMKKVVLVK